MKGTFFKDFRILYIFVLSEVLCFKFKFPLLDIFSVVFFYSWILFYLIKDTDKGIIYYISFTLLSLNMSNYIWVDVLPDTFFGIRIFGISLNFIVLMATSFLLFPRLKTFNFSTFEYFILLFLFYTTFIGLIYVLTDINYLDNFLKDFSTYVVILPFIIIFRQIEKGQLLYLIEHLIYATFLMLILSLLLGVYREYSKGDQNLLVNTFSSGLIFALFFIRDRMNIILFSTLVIIYFILALQSLVLFGGKTFIYFFLFLLWIFQDKLFSRYSFLILIIIFALPSLMDYLRMFYGEGSTVGNKIAQIQLILNINSIENIARSESSIGNLAGEFLTIIDFSKNNLLALIFGNGFGSSISDNLGLLKWWAGNFGYAQIDAARNSYHKMHLALFEILLKGGLVFFIPYCVLLTKAFISRKKWLFLFSIFFGLMFSVSKEFILLTLFFYYLNEGIPLKDNIVKY